MPDLPSFLGEVVLRSSFVLAATFALLGMLKRASASERHLVMLFGLLIVAFVPVGLLVSPKFSWTIPLPWQAEAGATTQKITAYFLEKNQNPLPSVSPSIVENKPAALKILTLSHGLAALILGGMLIQAMLLGRAAWSWQKIRRQALPAHLPGEMLERVRNFAGTRNVPPIFSSDQIAVPLLAGWLRPAILLPAEAPHWQSDRLAMVLYHELAHFRRGDAVLLPLICALRILYWWHPLVWLGLARLRRERENACDDLVLNQDFRATDYAELIVSTARQARAFRWQGGALAMASPSHLGERIRAILNPRLNRRPASRAILFTGLALALALGWFFVAVQVQAQDQPPTPDPAAAPDASKPQIELEFKLISIDEKTYLEKQQEIDAAIAKADLATLIDKLNKMPGVNLLSTPSVTTQEGLRATVDVLREMSYPTKFDKDKDGNRVPSDFKTHDVGFSIEAKPTLQPDHHSVLLKFSCTITNFGGWKDIPSGGRQPVFETLALSSEKIIDKQSLRVWVGNETILNQPPDPSTQYGAVENDWPSRNDTSPKRILLIITTRPVPATTQAIPVPQPAHVMVRITTKFLQVSEETYAQQPTAVDDALARGDVSFFSKLPDGAILGDKFTLTKLGEQTVLEAVKNISYPLKFNRDKSGAFIPSDATATHPCGIRVVVLPTLGPGGGVSLKFIDEITGCVGVVERGSDEEEPIFNTSWTNRAYELLPTDIPLGFWVRTNFYDLSKPLGWKEGLPPIPSQDSPRFRIGMLVSAKLYSDAGSPLPPGKIIAGFPLSK
jgi:beta-lactamase regulating signal transducer with metallopeptidase domain